MNLKLRFCFLLVGFSCLCLSSKSQNHIYLGSNQPTILMANAGADTIICLTYCTLIGGTPTASGGNPGYHYLWTPPTGLSSDTLANPLACPTVPTTYTVKVTDTWGCTSTSSVIITTDPCPGISQVISEKNVELYPNPANGLINLIINGSRLDNILYMSITNCFGQEVIKEELSLTKSGLNKTIDVSILRPGIYFLKLTGDKYYVIKKFVRN
jgi:hypothetical protein